MINNVPGKMETGLRDFRQAQVLAWCIEAFGSDPDETGPRTRAMRLVEEALELAQAEGIKYDEVMLVAHVVYVRPVGEVHQEIGGVATTLMAYCASRGLSLADCERLEIERIDKKPIEHFRRRQHEKREAGL